MCWVLVWEERVCGMVMQGNARNVVRNAAPTLATNLRQGLLCSLMGLQKETRSKGRYVEDEDHRDVAHPSINNMDYQSRGRL